MAITSQQRRKKLFWASAAGLGLLAVTLVLVNILAYWLFLRVDLTSSKAYSLSQSSKRLVSQLEDPIVIKAFFTPDLPPPYNTFGRYVRDILTEYRSASRGKIRFDFISPIPQQIFEQKAATAGLQPLQFEEAGSSQLKIRRGYMGLQLFYRDRTEVLPVVKNIQTLEYDITNRINKMALRQKKVIALASGHGETQWLKPEFRLSQELEELYEFRTVALPWVSSAPIQADALLVAGPRQKFDEKSLWAIDQAIMRGIPAIFLVDVMNFMPGRFFVSPADTGLPDLLSHYGAKLGDRLIYDSQCQTVSIVQNLAGMSFTTNIPYPFIPRITRFDSAHPLMRGLEVFSLPLPVTVLPSGQPGAGKFTPLFSSSPKSYLAPAKTFNVAPNNIPKHTAEDPQGPFVMGGLLEGPFTSYFQSKPIPVSGQALVGTSPKTSLFVVGSSHMLNPDLPGFPGTDAFITNMLAYLTHDETLLGIRSKGEILKPLKPLEPVVLQSTKILVLLGGAILAIVWGLARWRRRQSWRENVAQAFAAPVRSS